MILQSAQEIHHGTSEESAVIVGSRQRRFDHDLESAGESGE
jgi:hypothetical protein